MRFFKVNGMYINLDNVKRFFIESELWEIWADGIKIFECKSEKAAKCNLDLIMKYIKDGKEEY